MRLAAQRDDRVLLAPVIIRVARALDVDFVAPMILTAIVSNSAGLLTLVGDPATFLVGSSIGMSFGEYLQKVSLGGLLTVLALAALLPWLMRDIWNLQRELPAALPQAASRGPSSRRGAARAGRDGAAVPVRRRRSEAIAPPEVAIVAAALALLVVRRRRWSRSATCSSGSTGRRCSSWRALRAGRRPSTRPASCRASRTSCTRCSARLR